MIPIHDRAVWQKNKKYIKDFKLAKEDYLNFRGLVRAMGYSFEGQTREENLFLIKAKRYGKSINEKDLKFYRPFVEKSWIIEVIGLIPPDKLSNLREHTILNLLREQSEYMPDINKTIISEKAEEIEEYLKSTFADYNVSLKNETGMQIETKRKNSCVFYNIKKGSPILYSYDGHARVFISWSKPLEILVVEKKMYYKHSYYGYIPATLQFILNNWKDLHEIFEPFLTKIGIDPNLFTTYVNLPPLTLDKYLTGDYPYNTKKDIWESYVDYAMHKFCTGSIPYYPSHISCRKYLVLQTAVSMIKNKNPNWDYPDVDYYVHNVKGKIDLDIKDLPVKVREMRKKEILKKIKLVKGYKKRVVLDDKTFIRIDRKKDLPIVDYGIEAVFASGGLWIAFKKHKIMSNLTPEIHKKIKRTKFKTTKKAERR